ncbi:MAG: type VII toxin-antitoxin system MntA family adenylyltransferase antitoxin [Bacillota bacterium]
MERQGEDLLAALKRRLAGEADLAAAYLFGSRAAGAAGPASDLDLAVLFVPGLTAEERFWRRVALRETLAEELGIPVDLVDLAAAPPHLAREVLLTGKLLFCRDDDLRVAAVIKIYRDFDDIAFYRDYYRREVLGLDHQRTLPGQA